MTCKPRMSQQEISFSCLQMLTSKEQTHKGSEKQKMAISSHQRHRTKGQIIRISTIKKIDSN